MFTLIFTDDAMYISKRVFADWRAVRQAYATYKASLDGFARDDLIEFLEFEYPRWFEGTDRTWRRIVEQFDAASEIETIRM